MSPERVLVFDMDGVLVDVSQSYREAIRETVFSYTGWRPSRELIQDFKNQGGWNNDWKLSHHFVTEKGIEVTYEALVDRFNSLFLGNNGDGLICRERWIARDGLMERLAARWQLSIFTSRHGYELDASFRRLGVGHLFQPQITHESVQRHKPAPDGLHAIAAQYPDALMWYVGDTVDDGMAAREAGVPFVGIAAPDNPKRDDLAAALRDTGARAVLDDINQLESVLP